MIFATAYPEHYAIPANTLEAAHKLALSLQEGQQLVEYARAELLSQLGVEQPPSHSGLPHFPTTPIHVRFRCQGAYWSEGFSTGRAKAAGIDEAVSRALTLRKVARSHDPLFSPGYLAEDLGVEVTLFYRPEIIPKRALDNLEKALPEPSHGAALLVGEQLALAPNSNWPLYKGSRSTFLKQLSISTGHSDTDYLDESNTLWRLHTQHWVCQKPKMTARALHRCDTPVSINSITPQHLKDFARRMGQCLLRWIQPNGRLAYRFDPTKGRWSTDDNILRQWMATHALAELYHWCGENIYREAWRKNAEYNLGKSYRERGDYGYILHRKKAKLGAAACAAMAMFRGPHEGEYAAVVEKLIDGLWHQRQENGLFRTFFIPENRNDQQSFYSGEALLAMAMALAEKEDASEYSDAICQSKMAYLRYFIDSGRYAPFIPWHTMTYWWMHRISGEAHYIDSIFELNDYLLCLQCLDDNSAAIDQGRFYRDETAFHGMEHSSSTGIYVEGLCYAYDCAVRRRDQVRQQAYLEAIHWGLRSLMQLEFTGENGFYCYHKQTALGGIKTTPENPTIRCDNTQHAIMAVLAALKHIPDGAWQASRPLSKSFRQQQLDNYQQHSMPAERSDNNASMLLGGDVQLGRYTELWCETRGVGHAFNGIKNICGNTDLLVCNLECVVAKNGAKVSKQGRKVYHFRASPHMLCVFPENLPVYVSLANNHTMDYGQEALNEMLEEHLPAHNIAFAGAGKSHYEARAAKVMDVRGISVAFFSYTTIEPGFAADGQQSGYNYIDLYNENLAKQTFRQALSGSDADLNMLCVHWGKNHDERVSDAEIRLAHIAIDAGMSAVIGHHSHLTRAIEIYRGAPIFYDLGNFLVDFKFLGWDDRSLLVKLIIQDKKIHRIELIPVSVRDKTVIPLVGAEAQTLLERLSQLSEPFNLPLVFLNNLGMIFLPNEEILHA